MDPAPTWSAGRAVLSCSRQTRICSGAHPALVWRQSRRVGPAADGNAQMNRHSAFADAVAALDEGDFELLRRAVDERCCREKHGFGTLAEAADLYRTDPACPSCRAASPFRDGRTAGGVQRWRCRACGARFTSLTGTVLEGSKSDMATWCRFIGLMRFNVPLDAMAEELGITHQTAWEWRHRVMAAVDGYQDRIVLRDLVWIDETYVNPHRPASWVRRGEEARAVPPEGLHSGRHRRAQEPGRRGVRPRKAQLGEGAGGARRAYRRGEPGRPRQGEGARRADPRVGLRRGGAQGRRQRPGLPGADGHGEQPLLLAQAVPLEVHGHVDVEPPVVPQLVRLPVQGQAGLREMARDRKGGSPSAAHRGAFPQLDIANPSPVS